MGSLSYDELRMIFDYFQRDVFFGERPNRLFKGPSDGAHLATLVSISLTCKDLRVLVEPFLYKTYVGRPSIGDNTTIPSLHSFMRTIRQRPHLADYIRTIMLDSRFFTNSADDAAVTELLISASKLQRLEFTMPRNLHFPHVLRRAAHDPALLASLKHLSIIRCPIRSGFPRYLHGLLFDCYNLRSIESISLALDDSPPCNWGHYPLQPGLQKAVVTSKVRLSMIGRLIASCTHLRCLEFRCGGEGWLTDVAKILHSHRATLQDLVLKTYKNVTHSMPIGSCLRDMTGLKSLKAHQDIIVGHPAPSSVLHSICQLPPDLERPVLDQCTKSMADQMISLPAVFKDTCPELKIIELHDGTKWLADNSVWSTGLSAEAIKDLKHVYEETGINLVWPYAFDKADTGDYKADTGDYKADSVEDEADSGDD